MLGVTEATVCYQLRRRATGVLDGCASQGFVAAGYREVIDTFLAGVLEKTPENGADLHA